MTKTGVFGFFITALLACIFTVSAVLVILAGVRVYRSTADTAYASFEDRTLSAYLTAKIRQNDGGDVFLGSFDGIEALVLTERHESGVYHTYIYHYDGSVFELFIREDMNPTAGAGEIIMTADSLDFEFVLPSLIRVIYSDRLGESSAFIHTRSNTGAS
ncbi:MAG: DUF4860 domain-containing protein [Eubacteriales bacterium]|jgi:hypothetical protein|nr:DUF4860 domain-containing protein [Eubacteriales bacterium]